MYRTLGDSYHPQTNGIVEKANRTTTRLLATYVNELHFNWDVFVPFAAVAVNMAQQPTSMLSLFGPVCSRKSVPPHEA